MNYLEKIIKTCEDAGCEIELTRNKKDVFGRKRTTRVLSEFTPPKGVKFYKKIINVSGNHQAMNAFRQVVEKLMSLSDKIVGRVGNDLHYGVLERDGFIFLIDGVNESIYVFK
tara:strand:- start:272 stop:610 length:339 start_codon:yes stop_codon:yes gene_type:complete